MADNRNGLKLFIGLPTYGGQRFNTMALLSAQQNQRFFAGIHAMELDGSLLAASFNKLLITAQKLHGQGECDFFLLMHADIVPIDVANWLDQLMEARQYARTQCADNEKYKAAVISVVVPIKDHRGLTSIAIEGPTIWNPRRLTLREIHAMEQDTFTDENLLVNTGMLLIDMRNNDWISKIRFTISDAILKTQEGDLLAAVQPEDWQFSRDARALGVKLWATRKVKIVHRGLFSYPNFTPWGEEQDPGDKQ